MNPNDDPYIDRTRGAEEISAKLFLVTARSLRNWVDVPTILLEGRACAKRSAWMKAAERRLADALYAPETASSGRSKRNTAPARAAALQARAAARLSANEDA